MKPKKLPVRPSPQFAYEDKNDEQKRQGISVRLPKALIEELDNLVKRSGYRKTELIQYAIDQLCQSMKR